MMTLFDMVYGFWPRKLAYAKWSVRVNPKLALLLMLVGCLMQPNFAFSSSNPPIAVAANVKFAMDEIAAQFTQDTGMSVRLSYGSSGNFVSQIQHGAPFELLLSADEFYPNQLVKAGFTQDEGLIYAMGRLAIAAAKSSPLALDGQLLGVKELIGLGKLKRFAIANPAHAPYGERAQQVLATQGLWQAIEPHIILGENASQAAQFAVSGSTQGGIVPLSLVLTPNFARIGQYAAIDDSLYQPIKQRMVLMKQASTTAVDFYRYMQTPVAQTILIKYGFHVPAATKTSVIHHTLSAPTGSK